MNQGRNHLGRIVGLGALGGLAVLSGIEMVYGGVLDGAMSLCAATVGTAFMPHGSCYFWNPSLVGLHVGSDSLIALSYFSIPFGLVFYVRRRPEARFGQLFLLFGAFICLCGLTHAMSVFNVWNSAYWSSGALKLVTGVVSAGTAVVLFRALPSALKIPLPEEMLKFRRDLERESASRAIAESELKKIGQDLVTILKGGLDGFYLASVLRDRSGAVVDYVIREVNETELKRIGVGKGAIVGKSLCDIIPLSDRSLLHEKLARSVDQNEAYEEEVKFEETPGGESKWIRYQCVPSDDTIALFTRDISLRKKEEEELQDVKRKLELRVAEQTEELWKSENRYKLLTDFGYSAIWHTDEKGAVREYLPGWSRFTGQGKKETLGFGWLEVYAEEDREGFRSAWLEAVGQGAPFSHEARLWSVAANGHVPVRSYGVPVKSESGEIMEWIGAVADLSDQKRRERTLAEYSKRLSDKNKVLEEFAYVSSHDFQESLRKIRVYGEMLDEDFADQLSEEGVRYIEVIRRSTKHISDLLDDLLDYSRASSQELKVSEVSIGEVLGSVISDYEFLIKEIGAQVNVGETFKIVADSALLRVILQNFISNGLKYRSSERKPILNITVERVGADLLKPKGMVSGRCVAIKVEDNGIGFDESKKDLIFRPFQRLVSGQDYQGTGIGLAICVRVAERMGGVVKVSSTVGQGSVFTLLLPDNYNE